MPILGVVASGISGNLFAPSGAYDSIATVTVGAGGAATITFSSIPQTYTHLQIRCFAKSTGPTNGENTSIYFNNTSNSTGYAYQVLRGDGGSTAAASASNSRIVANVGTSNVSYSAMIIDVFDYTNTNKNKTVRNLFGFDSSGAGYVGLNSTLVPQTAATTQIDIDLNYNFAQYSSFALYGIKGA
jgi:hypothetical protein